MADRPDHSGMFKSGRPTGADIQAEAARREEYLGPVVAASNLYLGGVDVRIAGSQRTVHVVVDLPEDQVGGVSLDLISDVSRSLSQALDADPEDSGRPYELEVSSPGVGRPLTEPRHWRRNLGRKVKVRILQGEDVTGRVLSVEDDAVTLRPEIPAKKGMKPKQGDPVRIPFGKIRSSKVEIEFAHLDDDPAAAGKQGAEDELENEEA
ncbi:ribosome maturation factor RimP [Arthrobacter deserti]|uniref:Ribosome maturation factor RimP n=1 Tax=Arthrobacter deserti TaxID=1742687 RepID=A0ABX1JL99_9MICC|nr:ribosome maturation factor RimP [Arthrobacter deserti]